MIHIAIPNVGPDDAKAVQDAVEQGMLTIGPAIGELEARFSQRMGGV